MKRTSFADAECPIALGLESVGEWWTILILRDVFDGFSRFDELQRNLGISPSMLARRLKAMVDAGLLTKRRYSEHPPRDEYVLTGRGRDFRPVVVALYAWGSKHFAPEGASVVLVDARTGKPADPVLVDRPTGRALDEARFEFVPGPAASARTRQRLAFKARERQKRGGGALRGSRER